MNPAFADGQPLAEPLSQILLMLRANDRSRIVLAVADDPILRREAMAELGERLSGRYALEAFDYSRTEELSLPRFCRRLQCEMPVCVFAHGLEQLEKTDNTSYESAIHFLNAHREDIYHSKKAVVLWLAARTHQRIAQDAPDFVDWLAAIVTLTLPPNCTIEQTPLGALSLAEAEHLRHQSRRFENALAQPHVEPALRAELLKQLAHVLRQLGDEERSKRALDESARILVELGDYGRLEDLYRQHVIDRFGKLTFYSVTSDVPLAVDLERVFTKLTATRRKDTKRSRPQTGVLADLVDVLDQLEAIQIGEALRSPSPLVVLGAPGAGKTTLLKYLALTYARRQTKDRLGLEEARLPILLVLREFDALLERSVSQKQTREVEPPMLPQYLADLFKISAPHLNLSADFFRFFLDKGRCAVLLDGMDEIADPERRLRMAQAISALIREYQANRFVVTSRPRGYEGEVMRCLAADCSDCILRDFSDRDIDGFANSWYQAVVCGRLGDTPEARSEARILAEDLVRTIRADPHVQTLARNPLLLSVLAMVHQRNVRLPQRRAELYDECTNLLLGYWDQVKGETARRLAEYGGLNRDEKRILLQPIALWFHVRGQEAVLADKDMLAELIASQFRAIFGDDHVTSLSRAKLFLRIIEERAGLLVEDESGFYRFAHMTFQEYLAARAIADRDDYIEYTLRHLHDPWWREVILLEVGHLSDVRHYGRRARKLTSDLVTRIRNAGSALEDLLKRDLLFATRCLCDVGRLGIDDDLRRSIMADVLDLWRSTRLGPLREEIVSILTYAMPSVDGDYVLEELFGDLTHADPHRRLASIEALARIDISGIHDELEDVVLALLQDTESAVRREAMVTWASIEQRAMLHFPMKSGPSERTLGAFVELVQDRDGDVRQTAIAWLGRLGGPGTFKHLLSALRKADPAEWGSVFSNALFVPGVAFYGKPIDTDGIEALLGSGRDSDPDVRLKAVCAAGAFSTPPNREATSPALLEALRSDPDPRVRQKAAAALGRVSEDEEVGAALLKALSDDSAEVRLQVLRTVGRPSTPGKSGILAEGDTGILLEVEHLMLADSDSRVRSAAASALGSVKRRSDATHTVATLALALRGEDSGVRREAVRALGRLEERHPGCEALELLLKLVHDPDIFLRQSVIHALGCIYLGPRLQVVLNVLFEALKDEEDLVRAAAVEALGALSGEESIPGLMGILFDLLDDPSPRICRTAIELLVDRCAVEKNHRLVIALLRFLDDADIQLRATAAWALRATGSTGDSSVRSRVIPVWSALLDIPDEIRIAERPRTAMELAYEELQVLASPRAAVVGYGHADGH